MVMIFVFLDYSVVDVLDLTSDDDDMTAFKIETEREIRERFGENCMSYNSKCLNETNTAM